MGVVLSARFAVICYGRNRNEYKYQIQIPPVQLLMHNFYEAFIFEGLSSDDMISKPIEMLPVFNSSVIYLPTDICIVNEITR